MTPSLVTELYTGGIYVEHESQPSREYRLFNSASGGDAEAYQQLIEPYRRELLAHCYRMLGSGEDAEDALQDSCLRAWCGMARFEGRSSIRTWLYKIATNTCINMLTKRSQRVLAIDYGPSDEPDNPLRAPLDESVWIDPYPDELLCNLDSMTAPEALYEQRESLELAFIAAFQLLPPRQRAALILRDVLGFSAKEVAETLEHSIASVNSALQRARMTLEQHRPELSQQATMRALGDKQLQAIIKNYINAMERADVYAMLELLTEDATWSMPPRPNWYFGRDDIARFLTKRPFTVRWRHIPTRSNGQLAVGCYMWNPATNSYDASCLDVLTLRGKQIAAVTGFFTGKFLRRFGLPDKL
jgi:RNA polymerase sigma-70 factor, ECF subfamily